MSALPGPHQLQQPRRAGKIRMAAPGHDRGLIVGAPFLDLPPLVDAAEGPSGFASRCPWLAAISPNLDALVTLPKVSHGQAGGGGNGGRRRRRARG